MEKADSVMVVWCNCNPKPEEGGMLVGGNGNHKFSTYIYNGQSDSNKNRISIVYEVVTGWESAILTFLIGTCIHDPSS